MREIGHIIRIENEKISLVVETSADCASCGVPQGNGVTHGCTSCTMFASKKKRTLSAVNRRGLSLAVGDRIVVALAPGKAILQAFLFFIFPLLFFLAGYGITALADPGSPEVIQVVSGLIGMAAAFLLVVVVRIVRHTKDWPEVVAKEGPDHA
ncbi:MAG TPA: hypothetical protein ENN69_07990 [Spirochaetia bacterium]|nr:hypothetical protein [Spirochaetia bacterium]